MDESNEQFHQLHAESRNENLTGSKSTKVHPDEAASEQELAHRGKQILGRQPDELKATKDILPEDAQHKAELSTEE